MIELLIILLVLAWLGGLSLHIAGDFIHLLLALAVIVLIVRFIQGRRVL